MNLPLLDIHSTAGLCSLLTPRLEKSASLICPPTWGIRLKAVIEAGKMAQLLTARVARSEDLASVLSTHMVTSSYPITPVPGDSVLSSDLCDY